MDAFELDDLASRRAASGKLYHEFLRVPVLSAGLYVLAAGADDPQTAHRSDEVYVVMRGRGRIRVADDDQAVEPGSVVYVAAGVEHRFHSIAEELEILVVFAPAEPE